MAPGFRREAYLSFFGPFSLLALLAVWVVGLILGFGAMQRSFGGPVATSQGDGGFGTYLYMSGTTLLTLGLGDVVPRTGMGRTLIVIEVMVGFGVLALVIGYLPILFQAFSQREINVSLLDARAGSPPSAGELLIRHGQPENAFNVQTFLRESERWAAELMESHLSYPVLAYYRSQHENQSWVAALTAILDISALLMADSTHTLLRPARLTFATARHAAVDLARIFDLQPLPPESDRLPAEELATLQSMTEDAGAGFRLDDKGHRKLETLRVLYEPYVNALSHHLMTPLPPWLPAPTRVEYWRTTE
jgi:hypothetical protein